MPKKKQLEKTIRKLAKSYGVSVGKIREGGSHEIWECAGLVFPLPRHREIAEGTARSIVKALTNHLDNLEPPTDEGDSP